MAFITNQLNGIVVYATGSAQKCTLSVDCQEIACIATDHNGDDVFFEFVLLPCLSPPAVRIVLSTEDIAYDHTFYQREIDNLNFRLSTSGRIDVRLDHSSHNSIGLQVRFRQVSRPT